MGKRKKKPSNKTLSTSTTSEDIIYDSDTDESQVLSPKPYQKKKQNKCNSRSSSETEEEIPDSQSLTNKTSATSSNYSVIPANQEMFRLNNTDKSSALENFLLPNHSLEGDPTMIQHSSNGSINSLPTLEDLPNTPNPLPSLQQLDIGNCSNTKVNKFNCNQSAKTTASPLSNHYNAATNAQNQDSNHSSPTTSTTVIIKPSDSCSDKYFANPLKVFRLMQETPFKSENIIDTYRNLQKKIQVVKVRSINVGNECINVKKIGDFDIECFIPGNNKIKVGIIGPIGLETTEEEFSDLLNLEGFQNIKVKRMIKGSGSNAIKTKTMKLYFPAEALPDYIILMNERFKVTPFLDPPVQCYNCQRFGHNAKFCKNKTRCVICSEEHRHIDCPNKNNTKKCANCKENHTSNYGGCQKMKEAKEIQKIKVNENLSYRDALLKFNSKKQSPSVNQEIQINDNNVDLNNNEVSQSAIGHVSTCATKSYADVGTQTEPLSDNDKSQVPHLNETKLASCLLDILNSITKADSIGKRCAAITRAFNTHLGTSIAQSSLLSEVRVNRHFPTPSPVVSVTTRNKSTLKHGKQ